MKVSKGNIHDMLAEIDRIDGSFTGRTDDPVTDFHAELATACRGFLGIPEPTANQPAQRTGSPFTYERGDSVQTPLGIGTIHDDPDDHGRCRVMLNDRLHDGSQLINTTTFEFRAIIRKWNA